MLVIRRKSGESFYIGDNVEVRIVEINAHRVVLGIDAPSNVSIYRKEIREAADQNKEAARPASPLIAAALAVRLRQNSGR